MFYKKLYTKEEYNKIWPDVPYPFDNEPDDGYVVFEPVTEKLIKTIQKKLGYKLPESMIEIYKIQNGGCPINDCYKIDGYEDGFVQISGFFALTVKPTFRSILSKNELLVEDYEYPDIGIYFADDLSGHNSFVLDYRTCGKKGEPQVAFISEAEDGEEDYKVTIIAQSFKEFINNLRPSTDFEI